MRFRPLQARLLNALGDTKVVCLAGAPRTGKTSLVQALRTDLPLAASHSFADPAALAWATGDPADFLAALPPLAFLDEVQRAPGLLPLLKGAVDRGGRFLLATSRPLPGLAEALTWSLESFTLWPLAQAELREVFPELIDTCFQGDLPRLGLEPLEHGELLQRILTGGYPEVQDRTAQQREAWFHGYLGALVQGWLGDLTDLREVHHLTRLLAAPGADPGPARRCMDLLESLQVMAALGSGSGRYRCFNDPALQAHLLGMVPAALATRPVLAAPLLETFAVMELIKTAPWSRSRPALSILRAGGQALVVLENHRRDLVAITTTGAATVQPEAFQGIRELAGRVGARLKAGIVLHGGEELRAAGPGWWAVPFQALWAGRT